MSMVIDQPRHQRPSGNIDHGRAMGHDGVPGDRKYAIIGDECIVRRLQSGFAVENQVGVLEQIAGDHVASDAWARSKSSGGGAKIINSAQH